MSDNKDPVIKVQPLSQLSEDDKKERKFPCVFVDLNNCVKANRSEVD